MQAVLVAREAIKQVLSTPFSVRRFSGFSFVVEMEAKEPTPKDR